jgi:hypothetical protein
MCLLESYCGAVREKAGLNGRVEAVAARASGLRVFANDAILIQRVSKSKRERRGEQAEQIVPL